MKRHTTMKAIRHLTLLPLAIALALLAAAPLVLAVPAIPNPSFESNSFAVSPGFITGNVPISGWTASDTSLIGQNPAGGDNIFANNGAVPNGTRVAFIQSVGSTSTLSTTITGLTVGTSYRVQFRANARTGANTPSPSYRINGGPTVRFSASPSVNINNVFTNPYYTITAIFKATATTAALEISNSTAADSTLLVDNFTIAAATNITVTNNTDAAAGSLRAALTTAAGTPAFNVITFAPALNGQTITLLSEIAVSDTSGVVIDASVLSSGLTISGGNIIRIFSNAADSVLSLRGLLLTNGNINGGGGGAISNAGTLSLNKCTLTNNLSLGPVGGGAIYNNSNGHLDLVQCTLNNNTCGNEGGGLRNSGTATLTHCTFSGNNAGYGGGFGNYGTLSLVNSIIAGNTATTLLSTADIENYSYGGTVTLIRSGANIIQNLNSYGGATVSGLFHINDNPLLSALANNGGPTPTRAIAVNSPARNAAVASSITTDQRGKPIVGTADIGAFELQAGNFVFSAATYKTLEGSPATVTINRGTESSGTVTVRLITTAGTATTPADFTARVNSIVSDVTFAEGETTKDVIIPTVADFLVEGNHTFTTTLSIPVATVGASLGAPTTATVTIIDPIQVTNTNDDGPGSLRDAFRKAVANSGADAIHFSPALNGQTITLGSEIAVNDASGPVTVDAGNLAAGLTIDGGPGTNRIFLVGDSVSNEARTLTLRRLTLTGGNGIGAIAGYNNLGGAFHNLFGSTLTLTQCTVSGNTAGDYGGGIYNYGTAVLTQCTLSGNTAANIGGGISNFGTALLTQCTVSGNTAANFTGGGIENALNLTLDRSIVAGNTAPGSPAAADMGGLGFVTRVGTSIVPFISGLALNGTGSISNADPVLGPLANNGGPTKTHALLAGSPARNAATGSAVTSDQRGFAIVGGTPDIGAFEVQTGGTFALSAKGYFANEGAAVTVLIDRLGGLAGTASVRLFTTNGSAVAPGDYTARANTAISDVTFADGESSKNVAINTTPEGVNVVEFNESFTVTLGSPSLGTTVGTPASATVSIIDPSSGAGGTDITKPTLTISSPAEGANLNVDVGGKVTFTGTASDNKGVYRVGLSGGSNGHQDDPERPGATATNYTISDTPINAGINQFTIFVDDYKGNRTSLIRTVKVLRPLLVGISGFGSVTAGYAPKSYREVGQPQTLTATAGTGAIFSGWTILSGHSSTQLGTNATALEKATLNFIHREGLALRANFVTNPYLASNTGTFNGSIKPNTPSFTPSALDTEGYITMTVQTTGAFTGSLKIDGMTLGVAGAFDHNGFARFGTSRAKTLSVARADKPSLSVALTINVNTGKITGNLVQFDASTNLVTARCDVDADRAFFSATNPVPATAFGATVNRPATGTYTMLLAVTDSGALPGTQVPEGYSTGLVTVNSNGTVTIVATLADGTGVGTPVTLSTTLSQFGTWRLFAQLYPGLQGALAGNVTLDHSQTGTDFDGVGTRWFCPLQDREHYPLGWPDGITLDTRGSKYTITSGQSVVPLVQPTVTGDGNAVLSAYVSAILNLTKNVDISAADAVTEVPADAAYSLSINRALGTFSGSFTFVDGTVPTFSGVIYQKGASPGYPRGLGFFRTVTPTPKSYGGLSGLIQLTPQTP